MAPPSDFEHAWLAKFADSLDATVGKDIRTRVMEGSEQLCDDSDRKDVIRWSRQALERLESLVAHDQARRVMTGCACRYPEDELEDAREVYRQTGDIDRVHRMLQRKFESFLRDGLRLRDEMVREIIGRGWGLAGIKQGDTIIATKIPKSGNIVAYMEETDPEKKRRLYCHCPRMREVLKSSEAFPAIYCYCGAGFYKAIWEEILGRPVSVEVLKSVLAGDDVCKIAVHLTRSSDKAGLTDADWSPIMPS